MSEALEKKGIEQTRLACRQFAMLYFQFCRTLIETVGEEAALPLVQKTVFRLSLDRTDRIRQRALEAGETPGLENFGRFNDLPASAWEQWTPDMGGLRCPYAQAWQDYYEQYPWFRRFASLYCDVIDTTNIENYSQHLSHKITANLVWGDPSCEREYFESDEVRAGHMTYGAREE